MAILNVIAKKLVLPLAMYVVWRELTDSKSGMTPDELALAIEVGDDEGAVARSCVALERFGLARRVKDSRLEAVVKIDGREIDSASIDSFMRTLRWLALHNARLSTDGVDGVASSEDLVDALRWLLRQDPHVDWDLARAEQAADPMPSVINDVRWNALQFWAPPFGLASVAGEQKVYLRPNPVEAIEEVIRYPAVADPIPAGTQLAFREFLDFLAAELPVLVPERDGTKLELDERVNVSTAFALLCAEARGTLSLVSLSDAKERVTLRPERVGGSTRSVSHVKVLA